MTKLIRKTQQPSDYPTNNIHDAHNTSTTDTYSCNYINNKNLVFHTKLTEKSSSIECTGLDIVADGGIYDIRITGGVDGNADVFCKIDDMERSNYYHFGYYLEGTGTSSDVSSHTWKTGYRPQKNYFYYGHHMGRDGSVIEGTFTYTSTAPCIEYKWNAYCVLSGYQFFADVRGIYVGGTAMNKLTLAPQQAQFKVGTEVWIWKRDNITSTTNTSTSDSDSSGGTTDPTKTSL